MSVQPGSHPAPAARATGPRLAQVPARGGRLGLSLAILAMAAVFALTVIPRSALGFLSAAPASDWQPGWQGETQSGR